MAAGADFFGNERPATRTPHATRRRLPSPCFSLDLAAEQMAHLPLTGRGCLQGANVGRGFPSPFALVPADQTKQNQLWPFSPLFPRPYEHLPERTGTGTGRTDDRSLPLH